MSQYQPYALLGLYRLPSGRIAEMSDFKGCGLPTVTLKYLDNAEEITVLKSWLARVAVVV